MPSLRVTPGPLAHAYARACEQLDRTAFADALWNRRLEAWPFDDATRAAIARRLGWLGAVEFISPHISRLQALGESIRGAFTDVILLGMGGSSLAPEVLRQVLGPAPGYPRFRVLDSVDPDSVREALEPAATALFVLASKSGSTIEPNAMAAEARRRIVVSGEANWGSRFIAITDEHTVLHRRAVKERFRDVFINPSDIGGRYSALSFFGLVPAALMGLDLDALLAHARTMEAACRQPGAAANPGLALGALIAAGALESRDKLTLWLPPRLRAFALWIEQLVAESLGKQGKGAVPIAGEPVGVPLGADRLVVSTRLGHSGGDAASDASPLAAVPHATVDFADVAEIGAEFLRWEVATAAAGMLMGINPFDEPNVQQAKDATEVLLAGYRSDGRLPVPQAHGAIEHSRVTLSSAAATALGGAAADAFLSVVRPSDYIALLAYLPESEAVDEALQEFRTAATLRSGCATMWAYGPRYLHSTGQLHKGGANHGVFVVVTAEPESELPIPEEPGGASQPAHPLSFGILERAQAIGDFTSLDTGGRRALYVHLPSRDIARLRRVLERLTAHLPRRERT